MNLEALMRRTLDGTVRYIDEETGEYRSTSTRRFGRGNGASIIWTPEFDEKLRTLRALGANRFSIAQSLDCSSEAVAQRLRKLGLTKKYRCKREV